MQDDTAQTEAPAPEATPVAVPPAEAQRDQYILPFIKELKKYMSIERIREFARVTPKGLFFSYTIKDELLGHFAKWIESQPEVSHIARNPTKVARRLFGEDEPALRYLVEGKNTISGYLAQCHIQAPQNLQLPFYLGGLTDSREALHPKDPIFAELKQVEARMGASGLELKIALGDGAVIVTSSKLKEFSALAENSPRTLKEFPKLTGSLPETLRAFVQLLEKSRPVRKDVELFLSAPLVHQKKNNIRTVGSWVFVFDPAGMLRAMFELKGKNLYLLIRKEFAFYAANHGKRIGTFEIYPERNHFLGAFRPSQGREIRLAPGAFVSFVEAIMESPEKRDDFKGHFSLKQCFEKFSFLYQTAQPVEPRLISSFVRRDRTQGYMLLANGVWIFGISPRGEFDICVGKHLGPRVQQGPRDRRDGAQGRRRGGGSERGPKRR